MTIAAVNLDICKVKWCMCLHASQYQLNLSICNHLNKLGLSFLHFQKRFYLINPGLIEIFLFSKKKHEDPHTTFFCTPHDAGVVKDARFSVTSNEPPLQKAISLLTV